jgi:hypothetical protein
MLICHLVFSGYGAARACVGALAAAERDLANKKPAGISSAGFGRTCPSPNIVMCERRSIRNLYRDENFS